MSLGNELEVNEVNKEDNVKEIDQESNSPEELSLSVDVDPELEAMFKAGMHFGYSRSRRHPKMEEYIFGLRHNVEIFDLAKIRVKLHEALAYITELSQQNKILLFVGTKVVISDLVEQAASSIYMPYMSDRWIGGILTNFHIIRKRMDYFEHLKQDKQSGELAKKYTKKELLRITKELEKLETNFRGVVSLKRLPDALFIVDPEEESTATREARRIGIPIIALLNNDVDPNLVDYRIPGNDSSRASVHYVLDRVEEAWREGKKAE